MATLANPGPLLAVARPGARDRSTETTLRVLLVGAGMHPLADRLRALSGRVETVAVAGAAGGGWPVHPGAATGFAPAYVIPSTRSRRSPE